MTLFHPNNEKPLGTWGTEGRQGPTSNRLFQRRGITVITEFVVEADPERVEVDVAVEWSPASSGCFRRLDYVDLA